MVTDSHDIYTYKTGGAAPTPSGETSISPLAPALPGTALDAAVAAFAIDGAGETFALTRPGIDYTVTGSAEVDTVYVSRGTTVDATALRGGRDDIYFTGQWGDYTKTVGSGSLLFTRVVDGHTETVKVAAGLGANNDRLIFADGAVLSNDAKAHPTAPIDTIPGYDPNTVTPLPAAPVIDMVAGDDIINAAEATTAVITGTSFAHARIALTLGKVGGTGTVDNVRTVTADASGHWSHTLLPADFDAMNQGAETIKAVATDTAGNMSLAATRPITIDTIGPTVTIDVADTDGDGPPTISGTTEAGSAVLLTLPDGTTKVTTTADSSGHYSVELTTLPNPLLGTYTAVATDIVGNTGLPATSVETDLSSPLLGGSGAGDMRVNTTINGTQIAPKNVGLADGTFVTVWASVGQDGSGAGVYGQHFDAYGRKIGGEFLVNTYTSGDQGVYAKGNWASDLDVIALTSGGFQVVWGDAGYDGSGWGVYGQNYAADGTRLGTQYRVNTTTYDWQDVPQGAGLADGGSVVVWASASQDSGVSYGVYGQRFDASGVKIGGEFLVNLATAGSQGARSNAEEENVSVAALSGGGFVVTWGSDTGGVGWDTWARIFKADGTALTGEFRVNTYTADSQWLPQVTTLADGGFLVSWASLENSNGNYSLYGQRFTAAGATVGGEFRFDSSGGHQAGWINNDDQRYHDVIGLENGGWVAAWASEQNEIIGDIYYQVYDASGNKVGGETLVNSVTANHQYHLSLARAANGGFVISWDSYLEDGSEWSVQQKIYEADGLERMVDPSRDLLTNTTTSGAQIAPKSAALSDGGHVEIWASDQGGNWDVWGQRFDANDDKVGGEFRANTTIAGSQGCYGISTGIPLLDVIGLKGGGSVITWGSDTGEGSGWGLFGQRYDAAGVVQGAEFRVNSFTTNNQWAPQAADLADGGFIIVWSSQGQDGSGMGVYGQRYNATGVAQGTEFLVNTTNTAGDQGSRVDYWEEGLSVTGLKGGGFAVTWFTTSGVSGYDVNARIYQADGTPLTGEFTVNSTTAGSQWLPQVTEIGAGGFVVTWAGWEQGGDAGYGLYGQIYNAGGDKIGTEFRINTTLAGSQGGAVEGQDDRLHDVVGLANGGFVAVWTSEGQDGSYGTTYMQRFDALGNRLGSETRVANGNGDRQRHVTVNELADGGFVVAWDSYNQDATNSWGIYHKTFNVDGSERTGETWHSGVGAVAVAPDLVAAVRDGNPQMEGATVTVTNFKTGDVLAFTDQNGITGSYDGNGHLTLTGSATVAQYQAALRSVTFNNTSGTPDLTARDFTFTLTDLAGNTAAPVHADLSLYAPASTVVADTSAPLLGSSDVGDTRVNTNTYGSQWLPRSSGLDDGGYVTVWTSDITGDWNVYGQRFDAHGIKIGEQFLVNSITVAAQGYIGTNIGSGNLDVAGSAGGGFVVTWGSFQGVNWEVRAQFYDAQGIKTGGEIAVNTYTAGTQIIPQAAATADGSYVIVWDSSTGQDGSGPGVYGQRFNASGAKLGDEFRVNVTTAGSQGYREGGADTYEENISVTGLTGGGFAVTWFSDTGGEGYDVWGRIYKADGTALTGEFLVNRTMTGGQWLPQVTHLADGGFLATWVSPDNPTDPYSDGLYGQRFTATGNPVGDQFLINTTIINGQGGRTNSEGTNMDERMHDVTGLANGGWVATWESDYQDGSYQGMYLQVYDATGQKVGGETRVNTVTADRQRHVTVTELADGGFVVSWDSYLEDGGNGAWGTYQKVYEANGMERLVDIAVDVAVPTSTSGDQYSPTIGTLADGGYLVTWTDKNGLDGSSYGVFGQRYDSNGSKVGGQFQVNTATAGQQGAYDNGNLGGTNQSIIGLSDGGYVLTYGNWGLDGSGRGVYAQRYDAAGAKVGGEFRVNSTVADDQICPQGAATSDGGFVIAWGSYGQDGSGYGVYAQRYNASGVAQGGEFLVNTITTGNQGLRAETNGWEEGIGISALGGGGFVVTWFGTQSGHGQVYAQQFAANGTKVDGEMTVNDVDNGQWQWQPQVTTLADGGYLVAWAAYNRTPDTGGYGIWGQRYDADGAKVGNNFMLSSPSPQDEGGAAEGMDDRLHDVVGLAGGGWVASWTGYDEAGAGGAGYDALQWAEIYYQVYDAAGNKVGAVMRANTTTTEKQRHNEVTALADGGFVITWDSNAQDGSGWGIYKQTFNADGSVRGADAWHHGGPAVPVAPQLVASVADGLTQMSGATVHLENFHAGDVLGFVTQNGITGAYDNNGTLTLTGSATLAQYQAALRSVTFNNTSGTPDLTERAISFTLTDASNNTSSPVGATVHLYDTALYLAGTSGAETLTGNAGADTLFGNGADTLNAGAGDDRIILSDTTFASIDGGSGTDVLVLAGSGLSLDLTDPAVKARVQGIEQIHLGDNSTNGVTTVTTANTLRLNLADVLDIAGGSLRVDGSAGDRVELSNYGGTWTDTHVTQEIEGKTYAIYTNSGSATAKLLIDTSITTISSTNINGTHTLSLGDFNVSELGDSLSAVRINSTAGNDGELRLNGVKVTDGQTVTAADILAGQLVWVETTAVTTATKTFAVDYNGYDTGGAISSAAATLTLTRAAAAGTLSGSGSWFQQTNTAANTWQHVIDAINSGGHITVINNANEWTTAKAVAADNGALVEVGLRQNPAALGNGYGWQWFDGTRINTAVTPWNTTYLDGGGGTGAENQGTIWGDLLNDYVINRATLSLTEYEQNEFTYNGFTGADNLDFSGVASRTVLVNGRGEADTISGGGGNDTLSVPDTGFVSVNGNGGFDILEFTANGAVNGTTLATKVSNIEEIKLGAGDQQLTLTPAEVNAMTPSGNHTLYVSGTTDDQLGIDVGTGASSWHLTATVNGLNSYHWYDSSNVATSTRLLVDTAIQVVGHDSAALTTTTINNFTDNVGTVQGDFGAMVRYLRIYHTDATSVTTLTGLKVYADGVDVAAGKLSSIGADGGTVANVYNSTEALTDENVGGNWNSSQGVNSNLAYAYSSGSKPYIEIDLGGLYAVDSLTFWGRGDAPAESNNLRVYAGAHAFGATTYDALAANAEVKHYDIATVDTTANGAGTSVTAISGNVTDDATPMVNGTLSQVIGVDDVVRVYDNDTYVGDATVTGTTWSYTPDTLTLGSTHSYTAKVADAAGNTGSVSNSLSLTVDKVAQISSYFDNVGGLNGNFGTGTTTDDPTPTLNGTFAGGAIDTGDVVKVYDNGVYVGDATVNGANWSYTPATALTEGSSHSYTARVVDAAGNSGSVSNPLVLTVSTQVELLINGAIEGSGTGWGINQAASSLKYEAGHFNYDGGGSTYGGSVYQTINVIAGQQYTVRYQIEYSGGGANSHEFMQASVQNGSVWNAGTQLAQDSLYFISSPGYYNLSFTFTASSSTATVVFTNSYAELTAGCDLYLNKASVMLTTEAAHTTFTPLVLDLNGDGVRTMDADHGVLFDVGNTGMIGHSAWADASDGMLVRDLNGNGVIDHGGELFGQGTLVAGGEQAGDGFAALAQFDGNQDGVIDAQDSVFQELLVWRDGNNDGVSQADEVHSLTNLGITSLNLAATPGQTVENGNHHGLVSSYTSADGQEHDLVDVWFQQGAQGSLTTNEAGVTTLQLVTEGQSLDLTTVDTTRLQGVDRIDLTGAGSNTLTLSLKEVLALGDQDSCIADNGWAGLASAPGRYQLVVDGDGADQVVIEGGGFVNAGTASCDGVSYEVYNSLTSAAQLLVNQQVVMA